MKRTKHASLTGLIGAAALVLAACGGTPPPVSGAQPPAGVVIHLQPVKHPTPTPTATKPPVITLPRLARSRAIAWTNHFAGGYSVDSCSVVGKAAVSLDQPLQSVKSALVAKLLADGYKKIGSGSTSGPGYQVTDVMFGSSKQAHLHVTLAFAAKGKTTDVGYWVSDILKPKPGTQCAASSG